MIRRFRGLSWAALLVALGLLVSSCGEAEPEPVPLPTPTFTPHPTAEPTAHSPESARPKQIAPLEIPNRLVIPSIALDTPVVELGWSKNTDAAGKIFSEWDVASYAAGWHKNSAAMAVPGNMVMSGHNNVLGAVFRELDQLRRGDAIQVWSGADEQEYIVHDVLIVPEKYASVAQRQENARWIGAFEDDRLTLVSCWPRDDNTHRIIVVAFPSAEDTPAIGHAPNG